jgi:DNA-binding NarL/FixJ family response regulator
MSIRLLIADDHKMFVSGIRSLMEETSDMQVVATCHDGSEVLAMAQAHEADVILLDINMPGMQGVEACTLLSKEVPKLKVLVLSMYNEESYITQLLNNGAMGYVLKDTEVKELLHAIRQVHKGETFFSKSVTQTIVNSLINRNKAQETPENTKPPLPVLSRREKEILQLIVNEHSTQEIAEMLFISPKTVEVHRGNLLNKFAVRNTAGMVRIAVEHKLLDPK